jgi:hypothetical protein
MLAYVKMAEALKMSRTEEQPITWFIDRAPNNEIYREILFEQSENKTVLPRFPIYINVSPETTIEESQQNCCICMETREKGEISVLNCGHSFCCHCVKNTIESCDGRSSHTRIKRRDPCCPMCRAKIDYIYVTNYKIKFIMTRENLCL